MGETASDTSELTRPKSIIKTGTTSLWPRLPGIYGRRLAYVFLENGDMVNAILVKKGLAHVMLKTPNVKYKTELLDCQREAMKERLGIWSRSPATAEKYYLGNKNSYRFHRPTCPFGRKVSKKNIVRFQSRNDAFWEGYSPCKKCRP